MEYLLTNSLISLCVLLTVQRLKNAPAVLSFYLLIIALFSWLVPWHALSQLSYFSASSIYTIDVSEFTFDIVPSNDASSTKSIVAEPQAGYQWPAIIDVLLWLCTIGLSVFIWRIFAYREFIKHLHTHSTPSNHFDHISKAYPIRLTKLGEPAIATGVLNPVIWLESSMTNRDEMESVLHHELTHLKQGDIYWTWLICLIESIFWWNPLGLRLAKQARQQLELRCDELCMQKLNDKYQLDLASLLLSEQKRKHNMSLFTPPLLSISHTSSFNIQRIKMLNKEKVMKSKYLLLVTAAMSFSALAATQIVDGKKTKVLDTKVVEQQAYSEQYNAQLAALLEGAKNAKSENEQQLQQSAANILQWQQSRIALSGYEESELKILSFTLVSHIYHKLGQYQDVLDAYEKWYAPGSNPEYFLKNVLAITYMQMGRNELAISELESLSDILDGKLQPGSLMNLARAYIEVADYEKAMDLLNSENAGDNTYTNILRYYVYDQQNNRQKVDELKAKIPTPFAVTPAKLPQISIPGSPLLREI